MQAKRAGHWACSRNVKKVHVVKTQWMTESREGLDQATLCRSNVKDVENTTGSLGRVLKEKQDGLDFLKNSLISSP